LLALVIALSIGATCLSQLNCAAGEVGVAGVVGVAGSCDDKITSLLDCNILESDWLVIAVSSVTLLRGDCDIDGVELVNCEAAFFFVLDDTVLVVLPLADVLV